jgi:Methyltransferase FkbM domain
MGARVRHLPLGIGRGVAFEVDFRHQTKLFLGLYEVEMNRYFRELCVEGSRCFDIGADVGYDALVMRRLGADSVVSVDCSATCIERAARNVALNREDMGAITLLHAWVGAEVGDGQETIDNLAYSGKYFQPDLVKIDIEGGEEDALRGAERLLRDCRPHLIVETHGAAVELACIEILRAAGYQPEVVNARRWLRDNRPTAHNRWLVARGRGAEVVET